MSQLVRDCRYTTPKLTSRLRSAPLGLRAYVTVAGEPVRCWKVTSTPAKCGDLGPWDSKEGIFANEKLCIADSAYVESEANSECRSGVPS